MLVRQQTLELHVIFYLQIVIFVFKFEHVFYSFITLALTMCFTLLLP